MQNNRFIQARTFFAVLGALAALVLAGCSTPSITNLTAPSIAPNPSNIYTITARIKPQASNVVPNSVVPKIIIDEKAFKMTKLDNLPDVYEYEFQAPADVAQLRYYFLIEYQVSNLGVLKSRTDNSPLQIVNIVGRNSLGMTANRGPVGARIAINGIGFTSRDNVYLDEHLARSIYDSANSISFIVPALETDRNYTVSIGDAPGKMNIGTFHIDAGTGNTAATTASSAVAFGAAGPSGAGTSGATYGYATTAAAEPADATPAYVATTTTGGELTSSPSEITLRQGQTVVVKFITPYIVKGSSPITIDITTDIPESVIMPEVYVQPGSNVGSVTIEGGRPDKGSIFAKLPGSGKSLTIPVTIKSKN